MNHTSVKVAIKLTNDSLAIMDFLTLGRGDILPFGAQWADRAEGWWMREPTPANINQEIGRSVFDAPVASWRIIPEEIPKDRTFRDAWRDRGSKLEVDMPAARDIHRGRIRAARAAKLQELDGEWMRATGQGKKAEADAVEAKRQRLRDLPATLPIEAAKTPEELKELWDSELGG